MSSITQLRRDYPHKFVFAFTVASPERGGATVTYEGSLNCETEAEAGAMGKSFLDWIKKTPVATLTARKPPKGMVRVQKTTGGEETE